MITSQRNHSFGEPPSPKKKPRVYRETNIQKRVVKWIRDDPNWMVLRLENAKQRTQAEIFRDKLMGLHTGAPDLLVLYKTFMLWLELKDDKGTVSDEQEQCHAELRARKQFVSVGKGYDATIRALEEFAKMCDATINGSKALPF